MDVDILDKEIIIYLHRNDLRRLKSQKRINKNVVTSLKKESTEVTLDYDVSRNFSDNDEVYDDIIDALEEVDSMLWELAGGFSSFESIKDNYNWEKAMKTYEYYDNIRNQYK
jgi:hypothetical protein